MRTLINIIAIILFLLLAVGLYFWVTNIGDEKTTSGTDVVRESQQASTPDPQKDSMAEVGIKRIEKLEAETEEKKFEYGDYVYLGGPWGLLVGNKSDASFQQYVTTQRVQNVKLENNFLQYEEFDALSGTWEFESINLNAYEKFLDK